MDKKRIIFIVIGSIFTWISGWFFGIARCQKKLVDKATEMRNREDSHFEQLNDEVAKINSDGPMSAEERIKMSNITDERFKIIGKVESLNEILDDAKTW